MNYKADRLSHHAAGQYADSTMRKTACLGLKNFFSRTIKQGGPAIGRPYCYSLPVICLPALPLQLFFHKLFIHFERQKTLIVNLVAVIGSFNGIFTPHFAGTQFF